MKTVDCPRCGGGGFDSPGTGYNNVCSECGGHGEVPEWMVEKKTERECPDNECDFCGERFNKQYHYECPLCKEPVKREESPCTGSE